MEFDLLYMDTFVTEQTPRACDLIRDLKLDILLGVMSGGDKDVSNACAMVLTNPLTHAQSIRLRNEVVRDALKHGDTFESILSIVGEALGQARKYAEYIKPKYDKVISNSNKIIYEMEITQILVQSLQKLKTMLHLNRCGFMAAGLNQLCHAVDHTLQEDYISRIQARLTELSALRQGVGVAISGHLGEGLKQTDVVLNRFLSPQKKTSIPLCCPQRRDPSIQPFPDSKCPGNH